MLHNPFYNWLVSLLSEIIALSFISAAAVLETFPSEMLGRGKKLLDCIYSNIINLTTLLDNLTTYHCS